MEAFPEMPEKLCNTAEDIEHKAETVYREGEG